MPLSSHLFAMTTPLPSPTLHVTDNWVQTLESLRGCAEVLEGRNKKLEHLCNSYLYAAKEARAMAQVEREKCKVSRT